MASLHQHRTLFYGPSSHNLDITPGLIDISVKFPPSYFFAIVGDGETRKLEEKEDLQQRAWTGFKPGRLHEGLNINGS